VLRKGGAGIQQLRYTGTAKRPGYHYPKTIIWNDTLLVSYTTNKEDVEYTRVPVSSLEINSSDIVSSIRNLNQNPPGDHIKIYPHNSGLVSIHLSGNQNKGTFQLYNISGRLVLHKNLVRDYYQLDLNRFTKGTYIVVVKTPLGRKSIRVHN
jgi:hypothetical protein